MKKQKNKGRGERKERERLQIRKERQGKRRWKVDFIRQKGSGHHDPYHIVPYILSLQIPVFSSGRFCGGYCKGLESDKTEQYSYRICDFESKFPFLLSSMLCGARAYFLSFIF